MKINVIKEYGVLKALTDEDYDLIKALPSNVAFSVPFTKIRDPITHRAYFAFLSRLWEVLSEEQQTFFKTQERLRKSLQNAAGYTETEFNLNKKEWVEISKSIAYEKLDQLEFKELYKSVREVAFTLFLHKLSDLDFHNNFESFYRY